MKNNILIGTALKDGIKVYFGNFWKYFGNVLIYWIIMFFGLWCIFAISGEIYYPELPYEKYGASNEIKNVLVYQNTFIYIMRQILMGILTVFSGYIIAKTFAIRSQSKTFKGEYSEGTLLALGGLLSVVLISAYGTTLFWYSFAPVIAPYVEIVIAAFIVLFKGLIVLACCHALYSKSKWKNSMSFAWNVFASSPWKFIGFHLLTLLLCMSGFVIAGIGILITFPLLYVCWAIAYEQIEKPEPDAMPSDEVDAVT